MNLILHSFYNILIDNVSDMIFVMKVTDGDDFIYEQVNQAVLDNTRFDSNVIGKTIREVNVETTSELLTKRYIDTVQTQSLSTFEDMYINHFKKPMYTHTTVLPYINEKGTCTHIIAVVKDITNKIEMTQELEETKEHFQIIVENVADLVVLINSEQKIIFTSPSYNNVLGLNKEQVIGSPFTHNIHHDDLSLVNKNLIHAITYGKTFKVEFRQANHEKQWIWSDAHGVPVLDENNVFKHMVIVTRNINKQKEYRAKLQHLAMHDPLTNLPNRRYFNDQLTNAMLNNHNGLAILLLDIDRFKQINDNFGHDIGDKVIQEFGRRLQIVSGDKSMIARLGGDEFVILLPNKTSIEGAINLADKILKEMAKPWNIEGNTPIITTSIGIGMINGMKNVSEDLLMKAADNALYEAKNSGRNTYKVNFSMSEIS